MRGLTEEEALLLSASAPMVLRGSDQDAVFTLVAAGRMRWVGFRAATATADGMLALRIHAACKML